MISLLESQEEIRSARATLRSEGLDFAQHGRLRLWDILYRVRYRVPMPKPDLIKSWDVMNAWQIVEREIPDRRAGILDMGCYNSEILYALHARGYRNLHGCDLNPMCRRMAFWHAVRYRQADITSTPYPDAKFAAVTCLSVIEHGVPIDALVKELKRLLQPDGIFIFTTDYDATGGGEAAVTEPRPFGLEWQIHTKQTLLDLFSRFERAGFTLLDQDARLPTHHQRPITWNGKEYTFALAALRAP